MKPKLYAAKDFCFYCGASIYYLMTLGKDPKYFETFNDELVEKAFKSTFHNPDDAVATAKAVGYEAFNNLDEVV